MTTASTRKNDVIIIGAGIAGLTVAYTLRTAGYNPLVLEKSSRAGGLIQTTDHQGFICEMGPNTFLPTAKPLLTLISKLGIEKELIRSPVQHNHRYIFHNNKLQELHMNPLGFLKSGLVSIRGKLRLLWEPFAKGPPSEQDESIADFVTRRFGSEVLNTLVDPMVTGIIAGNPHDLSVAATFPKLVTMEKRYKSIFGAMRARRSSGRVSAENSMLGFQRGMTTLSDALVDQLNANILCDAQISTIRHPKSNQWEVSFTHNGKTVVQHAPTVILATPSFVAASLLSSLLPECVTPLSAIPYAPVTVVHLGYAKKDIASLPPGFGFLIPRSEKIRLLGTIWSSQIFSNRAPTDSLLMTAMYAGASDTDAMELSDNELLRQIQTDMERTLHISARPSFVNIRRVMRAIPQYTIGHLSRVDHIDTLLKTQPGLFLTGNYLTGYSVSDTILNATHTATETAEYLMAHHLA